MANCIVCVSLLSGLQKKYCSSLCKSRNHNNNSYARQRDRAIERKLQLVSEMGGACVECGYKKNLSVLVFHHVRNKSFPLDARGISNRSWVAIKSEAAKCILLCHNCHGEHHNPSLDMSMVDPERLELSTTQL